MSRNRPVPRRRRVPTTPRNRLRLRITLRHIDLPIWREISIPDSYSLLQLHRVIQLVFGWLDYHLFEFRVGIRRFETADAEATGESAAQVSLNDLRLEQGSSFSYVYDMGDYWEHDIRLTAVTAMAPMADEVESDDLAYLTDGARAAPPEDVGGPPGYEMALADLARRAADVDEGPDPELVAWLDAGFDPELFDRRAGDHALQLASAWRVI